MVQQKPVERRILEIALSVLVTSIITGAVTMLLTASVMRYQLELALTTNAKQDEEFVRLTREIVDLQKQMIVLQKEQAVTQKQADEQREHVIRLLEKRGMK